MKLKAKTKRSVYIQLALVVVTLIVGLLLKRGDMAEAQINTLTQNIIVQSEVVTKLANENITLKEKLDFSSSLQTTSAVKDLTRFYLKKYFGDKALLAEKVFTCESGLNPQAIHINKPGLGGDYGIAQINDKWHKARFEQMFGVKFEVGIHDYDLNIRYAKFLYDNSQGFSPWVCARIADI